MFELVYGCMNVQVWFVQMFRFCLRSVLVMPVFMCRAKFLYSN